MRNWIWIVVAGVAPVPWLALRFAGIHEPAYMVAALSGMAILGAAFLLSWASEVVQLDISQALAIVILSLISVLPEYSVDMYFAWRAGQDPAYAQYAVANMTGANRLLIGIGWSAVVLVFWWRTRGQRVELAQHELLEISVLSIATIYAFLIPIKGTLSILDTLVLLTLFGIYAYSSSRQAPEEPELVGPTRAVGDLPAALRRVVTVAMFVYAAAAIVLSAEPFAEGLVTTGVELGIDQFVLIQWIAPLASEAPEFIVAVLFAVRGYPHLGLRTMVSSKVNQWTLLVGMLPLVYAISANQVQPLVLDTRQVEEVFLTAAQSAFAVVLLLGMGLSVQGALALAGLFLAQFFLPEIRTAMAVVYLVLALGLVAADPDRRAQLLRTPRRLMSPESRR